MKPGWYGVLICWEVDEGFFPDAAYWTGSTWQGRSAWSIALVSQEAFESEEDASAWAWRHDIEDPESPGSIDAWNDPPDPNQQAE